MSASDGFAFRASKAAADMIWPDWQYPHCGTSASIQARWMGWLASAERPSMVVMFLPATDDIAAPHERVATPLIWTVQAPQSCTPQPNFVPVRPSVSRKTHNSGICAGTSTLCRFPLRGNSMAGLLNLPRDGVQYSVPPTSEET